MAELQRNLTDFWEIARHTNTITSTVVSDYKGILYITKWIAYDYRIFKLQYTFIFMNMYDGFVVPCLNFVYLFR